MIFTFICFIIKDLMFVFLFLFPGNFHDQEISCRTIIETRTEGGVAIADPIKLFFLRFPILAA
jgi:hypothetical protein